MSDLERRALDDGCQGDGAGLAAILACGYRVVYASHSDEGYGHHSYNELIQLEDGRHVHVECGGCSCDGFGSWGVFDTLDEAKAYVPESERLAVFP